MGLVRALSDRLAQRGYSVQTLEQIDQVLAAVNACEKDDSLHAVVSAGGDGTAALLVNRLPAGFPLAVLPLGTENLLAKYLGLSADPTVAARVIDEGRTEWMDVGRANGVYFLIMASCGFDAAVVRRMHGQRRGNIGHLSYLRPLWETITSYRYPALRITVDGKLLDVLPSWAFVFNAPRYAMNLRIAPEASGFDGCLDVCTFEKGSLWNGLMYIATILLRQQRRWRDATHDRCTSVKIESNHEVPYQLDGDPGGVLPLHVDIVPKHVRVIVPDSFIVPTEGAAASGD